MTDFMTALLVLLSYLTCAREQRARDAQFQPTCNLYRDSPKAQVYLCFLILSFLSICTRADGSDVRDLKTCLEQLKRIIEKSDAMLYAPSVNEIEDKCSDMALKCYLLELMVVIDEEEITDPRKDCIYAHHRTLLPLVGCPSCETYSLGNITIFMDRLIRLLEKMNEETLLKNIISHN
ncbi:interleukin-15 isoform 1-T1 [Menidia menidia]